MKNDVVLKIQNLTIRFGENPPVVQGLNMQLEAGRTLAVVGESGSGKSVTGLALMGLLPGHAHIMADELNFCGDQLLQLSENEFRGLRGAKISMIFQEPMTSLNPAMRCGEQVAEALVLHKKLSRLQAEEETVEWFRRVKLPDPEQLIRRYPHELSGGQRQRVMIAMAMCTKPALLIADEPTTALDVTVQKEILNLLKELQAEMDLAMIFITHDLGVVKEVADEVLVLYRGVVQEYGSMNRVIAAPEALYTKGLLACRPPLNTKPRRLLTVDDFLAGNLPSASDEVANTSPQGKEILLEVHNVDKFFAGQRKNLFSKPHAVQVLNKISFTVSKGETMGLVGESGCGKSTLGRNIIRLLEPESGQIIYKGKDITHLKGRALRSLRKEIQIIFQDPFSSLNPKQRIGDAIMEPMQVHGLYKNAALRKQRAEELLEKTGLKAEHFDRYPHEFSGGQRQRIGIARALAVEPELLICDESVSALDVSVQAKVLNLLNDLKDEFGLTYLFISHDLSVVKYFCDRIAVMHKGEIVELNAAEALYKNPKEAYTRQLIQSIPGLAPESDRLSNQL